MRNGVAKEDLAKTIMRILEEQEPQTVQELTRIAKEKTSAIEQEILEAILTLQNDGRIILSESPSSIPSQAKFGTYLKTGRALWFWLTLSITITMATVVFSVPEDFRPWIYLRNALGAIFVLWLPGYAFMKALFPEELPIKTAQKSLDNMEQLALSLGMSLALVPITGLLLNYTPWGMRLVPVTLSLLTLTLICAIVAVAREHQNCAARTQQHAHTS